IARPEKPPLKTGPILIGDRVVVSPDEATVECGDMGRTANIQVAGKTVYSYGNGHCADIQVLLNRARASAFIAHLSFCRSCGRNKEVEITDELVNSTSFSKDKKPVRRPWSEMSPDINQKFVVSPSDVSLECRDSGIAAELKIDGNLIYTYSNSSGG